MTNAWGLTTANMLRTLPIVLQNDPAMLALGAAIAGVLYTRPTEIDTLSIYASIDTLPAPLPDILAHSFKNELSQRWTARNHTLKRVRKSFWYHASESGIQRYFFSLFFRLCLIFYVQQRPRIYSGTISMEFCK